MPTRSPLSPISRAPHNRGFSARREIFFRGVGSNLSQASACTRGRKMTSCARASERTPSTQWQKSPAAQQGFFVCTFLTAAWCGASNSGLVRRRSNEMCPIAARLIVGRDALQCPALQGPVGDRPVVSYCYGLRSERGLCEEVELHLAYRWFCRLDLEDKLPDHSTFSVNRHGRFRDKRRSLRCRCEPLSWQGSR